MTQKKSQKRLIKAKKKWVSYFHRTAQPLTLASFPTWGIQQELVVKDLPTAKVTTNFILSLYLLKFSADYNFYWQVSALAGPKYSVLSTRDRPAGTKAL
jgi:hypothetical protein